ncbi:DUF6544 family protein [Larkinella sp. GY13]|uniref:DUF6544 family protein n=1 Tax=Larkinella sp. GY13 TaxID=3453720 RepID=UPI003EE9BA87
MSPLFRFVFAGILGLHGLIHGIGFVKEWHLITVNAFRATTVLPLSEKAAKVAGALWLLTGLVLLTAAVSLLTSQSRWWLVALLGIGLSQLLIVLYWPDAKAGTGLNVLILAVSLVAYADWDFNANGMAEVRGLIAESGSAKTPVITAESLTPLPPVVQKWLKRAGVVGKKRIQTVHLKQIGRMRTKPGGSWMPVEAEQVFTVSQPGFIWLARIEAAPLFFLVGRDQYRHGRGNMRIKALALVPVADAKGAEIDQGTMLRYLAETVWFPTAALSDYIQWEGLSDTSARATMHQGGVTASGVFTFNLAGDAIQFEARRFGEFDGAYRLETWSIALRDHQERAGGIRIPVQSDVTWKLKTGDFTWYTLTLTEIDYTPLSGD